jgi:outer membrane protein assembly factor BamD (BamD/ComL family)
VSGYRLKIAILAVVTVLFWQIGMLSAETWRLQPASASRGRDGPGPTSTDANQGGLDKDWKPLSDEGNDKFLLKVAQIKKLVNTGQTEAVRKAYDQLKKDFPEIAGPDLDAFIEAELSFCQGKFTKAIRAYDKLLDKFPDSQFTEAALSRQFEIATAFLTGQKRTVLRFFKMSRYHEGVKIMEKISTRAGIDAQIGLKAALALANSYEKRQKFNEAYLKWWEISQQWQAGQVGKDSTMAMARCKRAVYNKKDEDKRHLFDDSSLTTAKTYYEKLKLLYPEDAQKISVDEILKDINEQLAYKQLSIAQYYQKTGQLQAANLYYSMVINDWPKTKAAEMAKTTTENQE